MCDAIGQSKLTLEKTFSQGFLEVKKNLSDCYKWLGRRVEHFRAEKLPRLYESLSNLVRDILKTSFWLVPYIAFACGHYKDAAICLVVAGISLIDIVLKDKECREALAILAGAPLSINVAFKAMQLAANPSRSIVISIALHVICLAKLVVIAKGQNY